MTDEKQFCENCGSELNGEYCSKCGQRNVEMKLPFKEILRELIEELLSFDSRLFHSLIPFLIKPGILTVEYISGKRAHYISPFKMFFFMSFLYFFTTALVEKSDEKLQTQNNLGVDSSLTPVRADSIITIARKGGTQITIWKDDSGVVERKYGHRFAAGLRKLRTNPQLFFDGLHDHTPQVVFLLLPVFALLLKLIYLRSKNYYIEHVVFSFYFHSYVYLILLFIVLLNSTGWAFVSDYADVLFLAIPVNLYQGMKCVYRQSGSRTFIKFFLLTGLYGFVLIAAVVSAVFVLISFL
jgi:hypothetical protein